ncbi:MULTISPECIES: TetR/AcrR family transcriptional regulator [Halobacterium]|uniref:TetR/AcrR family transcriptional regulator n=1 Tax=Halobacterium TaxID=2239 RepID=UPI00073ECD43|nr:MULTISPECIES: TetR family transcriptional regulator C-terminal domain-containing protein [Halobacterium]MCG1002973.1 TetR family transcriptional regulator C-terminal domain-containing protein [Halobacterium noricense]
MAGQSEHTFSEQTEEIMQATYRVLCEHGYADLTIKRIAAEYGKSTAAVHYYYDTKDELLAAFLDYILKRFVDAIQDIETTDPEERLNHLLDKMLVDSEGNSNLSVALLEMRSQAPYKTEFRDRFRQNDEYIRYELKAVINHGIDEGVFNDVDASHATRSLATIVDGARTRAVVLDDAEELESARRTASDYVDAVLL